MASPPELTKAGYIDTRIDPALARARIDTVGHSADRDLARSYGAENDAFVQAQTAMNPARGGGWGVPLFIIRNLWSLVRIVSLIRKAFPVKNWKTTISGVLSAAVILLKLFGVDVPQPVSDGLLAVSLFLVGLFAKDAEAPKQ